MRHLTLFGIVLTLIGVASTALFMILAETEAPGLSFWVLTGMIPGMFFGSAVPAFTLASLFKN